jgi:hypothetical protein
MPVDVRREMAHINKEYQYYYRTVGEEVVWFQFDTDASRFDDLYDEGGRTYLPGVRVPALWVDQVEDPEQYSSEGRRPRQRLRFAVSAEELTQRGIGTTEAPGRQLGQDPPAPPLPPQIGRELSPWLDDRNNDVVYYDRRFYAVSNFQIRGRAQYIDMIIGVSAIETIPDDESVFDLFPWASEFPFPYIPVTTDDTGITLISEPESVIGTGRSIYIDSHGMSGGTWALSIKNESGVEVSTLELDTSQQSYGIISTTLGTASDRDLDPGLYPWTLTRTVGVVQSEMAAGNLRVLPIETTGTLEPLLLLVDTALVLPVAPGAPCGFPIGIAASMQTAADTNWQLSVTLPDGSKFNAEVDHSVVISPEIAPFVPSSISQICLASIPVEFVLLMEIGETYPITITSRSHRGTGPLVVRDVGTLTLTEAV